MIAVRWNGMTRRRSGGSSGAGSGVEAEALAMESVPMVERSGAWWPEPVRRWIRSSESYHSTVAFAAGIGYDSATLHRIDQWLDNLLLASYLVVLGALLVLDLRLRHGQEPVPLPRVAGLLARRESWLHVAIQFLFGGLFSAYVIFYLKSASLLRSLVFIVPLVALLVVNEYRGRRLRVERIQLALYCFCVFSFLLYFIPVATGWMSIWTAAGAAAGALVASGGVAWLSYRRKGAALPGPVRRIVAVHVAIWIALLGALGGLHAAELIPPVPLSLVHGGVYHDVEREGDHFALRYADPGFFRLWVEQSDPFEAWPGSTVHCFTAVFAPLGMELDVRHLWERWDPDREQWLLQDDIPFEVRGGRSGGFRGTTRKRHFAPGRWRVRVVASDGTEDGREIGRVPFEVVARPGLAPGTAELRTAYYR